METQNHSSIVRRLKVGGSDELTKLFTLQRACLRKMIAARLSQQLSARLDASDIVQEVFIRAQKGLKKYLSEPTIHPVVWLRILCKQLVSETTRKQYREKRTPEMEGAQNIDQQAVAQIADSLKPADAIVSKDETRAKVRELVKSLSPTEQEIIEMRHSDGYTFQEIADQFGIQLDAAKKRYYRALDRFRQIAFRGNLEP